jgi:hypothetical protein
MGGNIVDFSPSAIQAVQRDFFYQEHLDKYSSRQ